MNWREHAEVVGTCGFRQARRVLRRQVVRPCIGIMLDDAADRHARPATRARSARRDPQPRRSPRSSTGGSVGHRLEEAGLVAGARHETKRTPVQVAEHHAGELLHLRGVDLRRAHPLLLASIHPEGASRQPAQTGTISRSSARRLYESRTKARTWPSGRSRRATAWLELPSTVRTMPALRRTGHAADVLGPGPVRR